MSKPSDLVQGTVDLLLLKIQALEPFHRCAVNQGLKHVSSDVWHVGHGALYPALHKLKPHGSTTAGWKTSDLGLRAKLYQLTRLEHGQMVQESANREWVLRG